MKKTRNIELLIIGAVLIVFAFLLFPSLQHARREYRDGIRRNELANFKTAIEQINNKIGHYPLDFDATPHQFVVTKKVGDAAIEWYLRAELENHHETISDFDYEGGRNYYYKIENEQNKTFYVVCGGQAHCGAADKRK